MPLTHQTILITGAGGGLGGTAAVALAARGADVILLDNKIAKLEAVYDAIVAANGKEPVMYPFDLAVPARTTTMNWRGVLPRNMARCKACCIQRWNSALLRRLPSTALRNGDMP